MLTITKFNAFAYIVFTMAMTLLGIELIKAGNSYMGGELGLHPGLAYPLSMLCLGLIVTVFFVLFEEDDAIQYITLA